MQSTHVPFRMSLFKKCFVAGSIVVVLAAAAIAGGYHWATSPLELTPAQLDVTVKPHSSLRSVALQLNRGGVPVEPELFVVMTRLLGLQTRSEIGQLRVQDRRHAVRSAAENRARRRQRIRRDDHRRLDLQAHARRAGRQSGAQARHGRHERRRSDDRDRRAGSVDRQRRRAVFPRHVSVRQEHQRPRRLPSRVPADAPASGRSVDRARAESAVQDAVRRADHGVDHRKGNRQEIRPADGGGGVREPSAHRACRCRPTRP